MIVEEQGYLFLGYALVAQWIEHWTPVPGAEVRFLSGVSICSMRELSVQVVCTAALSWYWRTLFSWCAWCKKD